MITLSKIRNDGYKECTNCNALFFNRDKRFKYCSKNCSKISKRNQKREYSKKYYFKKERKRIMENYNILKTIKELNELVKQLSETSIIIVKSLKLMNEKLDLID